MKRICLTAIAFLACLSVFAQRIDTDIRFTLDHPDGLYELGDTVHLNAFVIKDYGKPITMTTFINGIKKESRCIGEIKTSSCIYSDFRSEPAAVMLRFSNGDDVFSIGYVVGGKEFKPGFNEPKDFRRFWRGQLKALRKVPMKASVKPVDLNGEDARKFDCYDVEINSIDDTPVRGYVAKPKNAAPKSLPIVIWMHAAGVAGDWCRSTVSGTVNFAKYGNGAISFDFNAHGMLNGQDEQYYRDLENGPLKGYSTRKMTDHESYYFRTMILRAVRALDYITQDPAWDGKTILVTGESQGGYQSVALAGLDRRVSDVLIRVPAGIGTGGLLAGRLSGWPKPLEREGTDTPAVKLAPYYDGAILMKGCRANFNVEMGLIDDTCPPAEIFSGINQVKGKVTILACPYRTHHLDKIPKQYRQWWDENVLSKREKFCNEVLSR